MTHVIRVIDFETTGMNATDKVVEAAYCDVVQSHGEWLIMPPRAWLCGVDAIPPEVRAIHHITVAEVADKPAFDPAELLSRDPPVTVVASHNWEFDSKFLGACSSPALCTYKAALRVWPEAPGHSNGALRYWLEDQGLLSIVDPSMALPPHRAGPDAYVTAHILKALLTRATGAQMVAWSQEPRLLPTCPLGKFRGKPWPEVEGGFLTWMLNQPTMEEDLKWNARRELERRKAPQSVGR